MTMRNTALLLACALGLSACATPALFKDRSELIASGMSCAENRFDIYFDEGQARLTEAAQAMITATSSALEACDIRHVRVMGLSDAVGGTDQSNLTLSERRARVVAEAFTGAGWPTPVFDVAAAGAAGSLTATGVVEPLRRRTEVVVQAVAR